MSSLFFEDYCSIFAEETSKTDTIGVSPQGQLPLKVSPPTARGQADTPPTAPPARREWWENQPRPERHLVTSALTSPAGQRGAATSTGGVQPGKAGNGHP